jgi:hypothetical protein
MHGVTLSPTAREDADLYVTADDLTLTPDGRVVLSGIALHVSGLSLGKWPQISRRLEPRPGMFGFSFPHVSYDKDSGLLVREQLSADLRAVKVDALLDYATSYGLRAHTYSYIEPLPGAQLGVAYGSRSLMDIRRDSFALTEDYNVVARQRVKLHGPVIDDAWCILEYGRMSVLPEEARAASAVEKVEDTRQAAAGTVKFALIPLGGDWYLATGGTGKYVQYDDAHKAYRVLGGEAGLVWLHGGFEHYVTYVENAESGTPVMSFDEVRQRELDFATSIRLHPEWRHVIRGVYDFDRDEFNKLEIGAMKKQKSYEIGFYWDVARNNAGIEVGLLLDK